MKKKDYLFLSGLSLLLLATVCTVLLMGYQYGSSIDWFKQHVTFASQFRQNFYETGNFFPDINWNNGCGINIFSVSYYGLLNPIILLSYLFPFIPMNLFIIFSTMLAIIAAAWIFYSLLIRHEFTFGLRIFLTLGLLCASPVLFHSHRQIMFINYLPFLMTGFVGVQRFFQKKKIGLLSFSVFLIGMTSYFYLISCLISITIYGIYCFLQKYPSFCIQRFLKEGLLFAGSLILGVGMAMMILLPTFTMLVDSGGKGSANLNIWTLLLPMNIGRSMLYGTYSMGLTAFGVIAVIYCALHKTQTEYRFLAIAILVISCTSPVLYLLNGTLYIRPKILIPFIPLAVIVMGHFLKEKKWNSLRWYDYLIVLLIAGISSIYFPICLLEFGLIALIFFIKKGTLLYLVTICSMLMVVAAGFFTETFIPTAEYDSLVAKNYSNLIDQLPPDELARFRIDELSDANKTANVHSNSLQKKISIYSSSYNKLYNEFYYDILRNANSSNNNISVMASANPISNPLLSSKYFITSNQTIPYGYRVVASKGNYSLLENSKARSIAYQTNVTMSLRQFNQLDEIDQLQALMQYTVIPGNQPNMPIQKAFHLSKETVLNQYEINNKKESRQTLTTNYKSPVIYLSFRVEDLSSKGAIIKINGVTNKLSPMDAPYFNDNHVFHYFLTLDAKKQLSITFSPGHYKIKDVRIFEIDPGAIEKMTENDQPVHSIRVDADTLRAYGNFESKSIFATTFPYDKGFHAYVDQTEVPVQKVNVSFVGFPVPKGQHQIKIIYHAPMKTCGLLISTFSFILFIGILGFTNRKEQP